MLFSSNQAPSAYPHQSTAQGAKQVGSLQVIQLMESSCLNTSIPLLSTQTQLDVPCKLTGTCMAIAQLVAHEMCLNRICQLTD